VLLTDLLIADWLPFAAITQASHDWFIIQPMKLSRSLRKLGNQIEDSVESVTDDGSTFLRNVGWISAGITAVALGVVIGRELRQRYKFNRRTPYDFYAHSGDQAQDVEFGVGI
jgi:hypothetical protein